MFRSIENLLFFSPFVIFAAVSLVTSEATASVKCDPSVDYWECECPPSMEGNDSCEMVPMSSALDLSDLSQIDRSSWFDTSWNASKQRYEVVADVSDSGAQGVFWSLPNEGQWQTMEELVAYASDFLGVPVDPNTGSLHPFVYVQRGIAVVYYPGTNEVRRGENLLEMLMTAGDGTVYVDEQPVTAAPEKCSYVRLGGTGICELNGGECKRTVQSTDGVLSASLFSFLRMEDEGDNCASHSLYDLKVDGGYYVQEDPQPEEVQHTNPLICDPNSSALICELRTIEEIVEPPSISPVDPQYDFEIVLRLIRVRADMALATQYYSNDDNKGVDNLGQAPQAFALRVDQEFRTMVNGTCAEAAVERGSATIELADGFSDDGAISKPTCAQ